MRGANTTPNHSWGAPLIRPHHKFPEGGSKVGMILNNTLSCGYPNLLLQHDQGNSTDNLEEGLFQSHWQTQRCDSLQRSRSPGRTRRRQCGRLRSPAECHVAICVSKRYFVRQRPGWPLPFISERERERYICLLCMSSVQSHVPDRACSATFLT